MKDQIGRILVRSNNYYLGAYVLNIVRYISNSFLSFFFSSYLRSIWSHSNFPSPRFEIEKPRDVWRSRNKRKVYSRPKNQNKFEARRSEAAIYLAAISSASLTRAFRKKKKKKKKQQRHYYSTWPRFRRERPSH